PDEQRQPVPDPLVPLGRRRRLLAGHGAGVPRQPPPLPRGAGEHPPAPRPPVAGGLRTSPLPSAEMDAAGTAYVVWQDCRFRSGCASNDIILSKSTSETTWGPATRGA